MTRTILLYLLLCLFWLDLLLIAAAIVAVIAAEFHLVPSWLAYAFGIPGLILYFRNERRL